MKDEQIVDLQLGVRRGGKEVSAVITQREHCGCFFGMVDRDGQV